MDCTPAPTCLAALHEATHRWPNRDNGSDGICASSAHHQQNPSSDHETGDAFDLTHDPEHGVDSYKIADWLRERVLAGKEKRVKYIISNRRIFNPSVSPAWRYYGGSNPHKGHCHVSLVGGPYSPASVRNDVRPWWDGYGEPVIEEDEVELIRVKRTDPNDTRPGDVFAVVKGFGKTYIKGKSDLAARGLEHEPIHDVEANDPRAKVPTLPANFDT